MKTPILPVAPGETSPNVALLHKTLAAFGLPVAAAEAAARTAGKDTRAQVRALQKRLNVPIDDATLVDDATAAAVGRALKEQGLTSASRSFTMTGPVRQSDGSAARWQRLMAFDLDVHAVGVYREIATVVELEKHGGFTPLAPVQSDGRGQYRLTFYDWQAPRGERKKAAVVVYAIDEERRGARIVGRSRLVHLEEYAESGLVRGLAVTVTRAQTATEYDRLMSSLAAFHKENGTTMAGLSASRDQLAFAAAELGIERARLHVAAAGELLGAGKAGKRAHELLYGIGRRGVRLTWQVLHDKSDEELALALESAAETKIIGAVDEKERATFLKALRDRAVSEVLGQKPTGGNDSPTELLARVLPKESQRIQFLNAVATFRGNDYRDFWEKHLLDQAEFKADPALASTLLMTQRLSHLTANHHALVTELQVTRTIASVGDLLALTAGDWLAIVKKTGVPASFPQGSDPAAAHREYAQAMEGIVNATFPTERIGRMVASNALPIAATAVAAGLAKFFQQNPDFDIATSRVHQFDQQIGRAAGREAAAVKAELQTVQRVFQVSPSPEVLAALLKENLRSAHAIASIPRKSFLKAYGTALGGMEAAYLVHQRSEHIATKAELSALHMMEYSHGELPASIMDDAQYQLATKALQNQVPNYSQLFGRPDICECEHCRSVYSAAAYLVDLLRFLWRGPANADGKTPLDLLAARRPDLLTLPLTCENTNTLIPYIDLANEVMEYYTVHDSLTAYTGYDTGEATADDLRASPQNLDLDAYRKLKDVKYPFSLPYHQPLDVIRTYSDHLKVSRYEALDAMNPVPSATTATALAAEALRISQEEYQVLTGTAFDGTADATPLHAYFGYTSSAGLAALNAVPEFLRRAGVKYVELVELINTSFLNPFQGALAFLQKFASYTSLDANTLYARLGQIEAGTLVPANDPEIAAGLAAYNGAQGTSITSAHFAQWVADHLGEFRQVITLYEPQSQCALDTTALRTIESIYSGAATSGISDARWSAIHRFIRLWRKLGWTIHETDVMLGALGATDITAATIATLESVSLLKTATKLAPDRLAVAWGSIDIYGKSSLYQKLFLTKAVQQADTAFLADAWGNYLQDGTEVLADHQSAILAAFRIREEDLTAILSVAQVIDGGNPRPLDLATDTLNLAHLSVIYRYAMVAKALKWRIADLCTLIDLFGISPFSLWDVQQQRFTSIDPNETYELYRLADAVKKAGFKTPVLQYILQGTLPLDSRIGLDPAKSLRTAKAIREAFGTIEKGHPDTPPAPLIAEILTGELALTFQPDIVARFMGILDGSATFQAMANANLTVVIPDALAPKYAYVKGSGRLTCTGIMSDSERATLSTLANADQSFVDAVTALHTAPEAFIAANFAGVFTDLPATYLALLDRPAPAQPTPLEDRYAYAYNRFVPILKARLRRDAIVQHVASLIGLGDEATSLLIAQDVDALIADLSIEGFSATYYSDATWTAAALSRTDTTVDFAWKATAPAPAVPADNFSVRWEAYLAAPASGEYTLRVDVAEADDLFRLYMDGVLILEKMAGDVTTSWDVVTTLNAAQMHLLRFDYAETAQNATARLQWLTTTAAPEVVPASVAYPAAILDAFTARATRYHRAAKFIMGFGLTTTELNHLLTWAADFGNIDFQALTPADWRRVNALVALRKTVPQAQALLTDLFLAANTTTPPPTLVDLKALLNKATAWDTVSLDFLVDTQFALGVADFKNEIALVRLAAVMQIATRTGLSAETIAEWGTPSTDFDELNATALLLKDTVKAKYEDADWVTLAGKLSNAIRKHQQEALVAYLLTRPAIQTWGATDADGLFEYFLIDVQMGACMDTSRVVQANAAIQMFVNRCLLNLESDTSTGVEKGVSPDAIDRDRWEWVQYYRVWEANRKVFLYPENWLEPEWRNDRSEFFKELEGYLVQNDITDRSVEAAFRGYLGRLNEVAHLEVCGLHRESYDDGALKYLHVFARTHNAPYTFFYRRWNEYRKWSPWERLPVDIRSVDKGNNSGVHLIPVVWKKRLFLFWPEFVEVKDPPESDSTRSAEEMSGDSVSSLQASTWWEIHLAWSECQDGKWSPKQVSKEVIRQLVGTVTSSEARLRWIYTIDKATQELQIVSHCEFDGGWAELGTFVLSDITSKVELGMSPISVLSEWNGYGVAFMNFARTATLELADDLYLKNVSKHRVLVTPTREDYTPKLDSPFFFSDQYRSYFVRPVDIKIPQKGKYPEKYPPEFFDPIVKIHVPIDIPPVDFDSRPPELVRGGGGDPAPDWLTGRPSGAPVGAAMMMTAPMTMAAAPMAMAAVPAAAAPPIATSSKYAVEKSSSPTAFGGVGSKYWQFTRPDHGLEFHTFYHPYSSEYVKRLNQLDIPGLLASDTTLPSDEGATFVGVYNPNFASDLVQKPADFPKRTYYKENVCFDPYGANSQYNWELFFHAPLYIATRLSKNGKFSEAMNWFHYIFDPTTDEMPGPGESEMSRYWKVLPFKTTPTESLEDWFRSLGPNGDPTTENAIIAEWRDNPFDPHLVAANRPLAYMKNVVIKYVENLIAWGDSLFRQFTRESVYEAMQIYVIANHILGPRPEFVPKRGEIKAESYDSLKDKWDDFSNALVALENIFPYSSDASISSSSSGTSLLGVGSALYFCIPANEKLIQHWNTVADRLFKIRHCQDIDGVERTLALFAPPIDPAALIQAASQGLSLGSILADLSSPPPLYRFTYLIQKANEFCADVRGLGSALLAALEKKDGEELSRLRASHETQMLELMTAVKERQILEARANKENLDKSRLTASVRFQHYLKLLGNSAAPPPPAPALSTTLNAESTLPADTAVSTVVTDVDEALVDSAEAGVKLIAKEQEDMTKSEEARKSTGTASMIDAIGGLMNFIPGFSGNIEPFGIGMTISYGGSNIAGGMSGIARFFHGDASDASSKAAMAGKMASFIRREQDWTLQANLAAREIVQLDKQIVSAEIRIQSAVKELENHNRAIENAKAVELFLQGKFTNQELYQWMKEQLFAVYKQGYNLAYDMAKKAEKAYKYEIGDELASFIQYGYWDNARQGLVSGEKLQLALRQMENAYLEDNRRELELTKSISLARVSPHALLELRETGRCYVSIPEELFDFDFRGHYFRRIKSVRLSIPCVAGPYTSVSCTLRLLNNTIRINTEPNQAGAYEHENDAGVWLDDTRFRTNHPPVTAIATSTAQGDSGTFEFNFRDERYLPFELAGAISEWQLELSTEKELRPFDYATIADAILHVGYTARESGGQFKESAATHLREFLENAADLTEQPLQQMFSMRHDFPTEWHRFLHPAAAGADQSLNVTLGDERFPFLARGRDVIVDQIALVARCAQATGYHATLSYVDFGGARVTSTEISMPENDTYGGLNAATVKLTDAGLVLDELDIGQEIRLRLRRDAAADFRSLATNPDEAQDLYVVIHYKLQDK
ncbi:MAG: hypothetical protein HOP28_16580 [Gemmatimonadales bacterium]|nr:hypothetical protein [Gemmatimonadales bacterium]